MGILRAMKVGDWALIACALALSAALAVWVWLPGRADAGVANVYVDGELRASLPLDEDTVAEKRAQAEALFAKICSR